MLIHWLSFAVATLGVGKIPKAPGTWCSLLAVLVWWAIPHESFLTEVLLILIAFVVGWIGTHYYEKLHNKHDPKEVVVDELIGMWLTLLVTPKVGLLYALGFIFFRIFDIWKPFPIGWIDRNTKGALGTILDDVVAGVFAFLLLKVVLLVGYFNG